MHDTQNPPLSLQKGYALAKDIIRRHAKIFYLGAQMLPKDERLAIFVVYAVARYADESVDDIKVTDKRQRLAKIAAWIESSYGQTPLSEPLLQAFRHTVQRYRIPFEYFDELICGMRMDLDKTRYADFGELNTYCYRVAGVIGLITLNILGASAEEAREHAVELGTAMQLTNIARDVREDWQKGRVYLPQDELTRFGVTEDDIARSRVTENFASLMRFQLERARGYYRRACPGIQSLPSPRVRLVVLMIMRMYAQILTEIERRGYDIFSRRVYLNSFQRASLMLETVLKRSYL
ncbi:MAG: phytoene/squalene synthase family protein [Candidatus Omnitrophica bacterium]|nr:phytoene/squalene synthase family protein [Candidatus Omnitrophota bacterium]